jgi:WD40 repeat protein
MPRVKACRRTLPTLMCIPWLVQACGDSTHPTATGSIQVSVTTSGQDRDSDGYTVSIDGQNRSLSPNGSATIENITAGEHTVELTGLAANCSPTTPPPLRVTVTAGALASVAIAINCSATTGGLTITSTTTGRDTDADGYTVSVDEGAATPVSTNGFTVLNGLAPGNHTVRVGGLAENCSLTAAPADAIVVAGAQTPVFLLVLCIAPLRNALVYVALAEVSTQLYTIKADGTNVERLTHDSYPYSRPAVSPDGLEIAFISPRPDGGTAGLFIMRNDGGDARPVITSGPPPDAVGWTPDGRLVIAQAPAASLWPDLCYVNRDGTGKSCVHPEDGRLFFGDFTLSPDGQRVIYVEGPSEFVLMNADGTGIHTFTFPNGRNYGVAWSPDGQRIAFNRVEDRDGDGQFESEIYTMKIDGTDAVRLTNGLVEQDPPHWSPDAQRIVYGSRAANGDSELRVVNADGGNDHKLTPTPGRGERQGHWSPIP